VLFASPHSGARYSDEFVDRTVLSRAQLRSSEDAFVDELFACAPQSCATFMRAMLPRAWIDLNRAKSELDPALIADVPKARLSARIASGLGVVPRVVAGGRQIYSGKLSFAEAQARLARDWQPYHDALRDQLTVMTAAFGQATLIDCHSMPHVAVANRFGSSAEVVLGNRFGASCDPDIFAAVDDAFRALGFRTAHNAPFAGAYIVEHYGRPQIGQHAIQVEIDRSLYMDEVSLEKRADYGEFKARISEVIRNITRALATDVPLAAQ